MLLRKHPFSFLRPLFLYRSYKSKEPPIWVALLIMGFSLLSAWQARNKKPPAMRVETIRYTHKNTFPLR